MVCSRRYRNFERRAKPRKEDRKARSGHLAYLNPLQSKPAAAAVSARKPSAARLGAATEHRAYERDILRSGGTVGKQRKTGSGFTIAVQEVDRRSEWLSDYNENRAFFYQLEDDEPV